MILWDKNNFDRIGLKGPKTIARLVYGELLDADYRATMPAAVLDRIGDSEVFLKPSHGSGIGIGVRAVRRDELAEWFESGPKSNFIIQEAVQQSDETARFHPPSVNTLRILTYRTLEGKIVNLSNIFRMGSEGKRIDNFGAGGAACAIHEGRLVGPGATKDFKRINKHPDTSVAFDGVVIPGFANALKYCLDEHLGLPWADILSWDIAIDRDHQPVFIELNTLGQEINFHQLCNGPIFAPVAEDIAARLKGRWRAIGGTVF